MCGFVMSVALLGTAVAQLPLPQVPVPRIPLPQVQMPGVADAATGTLRSLSNARELRVERMYRDHPAELDRVDHELVVRAEVVALDITVAALAAALKADFRVRRSADLADLGVKITVLQTPAGWSAARGLKRLRKLDPQGSYDYNHVYLDSGETAAPVRAGESAPAVAHGAARLGLIDGGVDETHRALLGVAIHRFGCNGAVVPSAHGTAVASLALRTHSVGELFAADVYCGAPTGGAIDSVAAAFGWMAREHIAVINVSLAGPRNVLLERVVQTLVSRGHVIVAAVGNDGPAAPPLFPASYDGVVGVTAVDGKHRALVEAGRGKQVDFAALGLEEKAAVAAPDTYAPVRGTSFAAPIVAGLLAAQLPTPDPVQRQQALDALALSAADLGAKGRDDVYGAGEVGALP